MCFILRLSDWHEKWPTAVSCVLMCRPEAFIWISPAGLHVIGLKTLNNCIIMLSAFTWPLVYTFTFPVTAVCYLGIALLVRLAHLCLHLAVSRSTAVMCSADVGKKIGISWILQICLSRWCTVLSRSSAESSPVSVRIHSQITQILILQIFLPLESDWMRCFWTLY